VSCATMRGARQRDAASPALQSLMRDYDAEAWQSAPAGGAKLYGHYPDGRQYAIAVARRKQIEERARMLAASEAQEAMHHERR